MLVSTITQTNDYDLTCDIEEIPAQHSSNVEFVFNKLDKYSSYTTEVHFAHLENRFVECSNIVGYATTIDRTGKFKLPSVAFEKDGYIAINFSLTNANETIYTKPLVYKVHKSVSGTEHINNLPWEQLVINFVDNTISPLVEELEVIKNETEEIKNSAGTVLSDARTATANANTATTNANEAAKKADTATTNAQNAATNANNATTSANSAANSVVIIRNGTVNPSSSLGKSGDFYINTTNGNVYLKSDGTWSYKFNMTVQNGSVTVSKLASDLDLSSKTINLPANCTKNNHELLEYTLRETVNLESVIQIFGFAQGNRLARKAVYFKYSSTEQWTGDYWLDEKKIYIKTLTGTYTKGSSKYIATGVPNIDKLWIDESASYIYADGTAYTGVNVDVRSAYIYCWYRTNNASSNKNTLELNSNNWSGEYAITIRYTKTG